MTLRAVLLILVLAFQGGELAASPPPQDGEVVYRIRPGDNLYTLAERHLLRTSDFRTVQRLNRIADPYRLSVRRTLRIPRNLLRFDRLRAKVTAFRGTVRVAQQDGSVRAAQLGQEIAEGAEIVTGTNSFVTLRLPDQSVVTMPSRSRVAVHRLRRYRLTGGVERLFKIVTGRARAIVRPMQRDEDDFRFSTPVAVSAVRGTEFRMAYRPEEKIATTEVIEGTVTVGTEAEPETVTVPAGFGTASATSEALRLLPAPKVLTPGAVQDDERLRFDLQPLPGAIGYRVQIAQDAGFLDVISEADAPSPVVELDALPDGTWFVRASAIDRNGLEGLADTYSFQRRLNTLATAIEQRRTDRFREYLFRWEPEGEGTHQFRFQLKKVDGDDPPLVDEPGLATRRLILTNLPPGEYEWRVHTLQFIDGAAYGKWSAAERLTVPPDQ